MSQNVGAESESDAIRNYCPCLRCVANTTVYLSRCKSNLHRVFKYRVSHSYLTFVPDLA